MSEQPEVIWARLDNATLYADGSSPCVARTKEFANGTKYVRAASSQAEIERLKAALSKVANEVFGLSAFEAELRSVMGNTNWNVLRQRAEEARAALSGSKE